MDKTIIEVAKRNCNDVVPLFYPMPKAGSVQISAEAMYNGMVAAWSGSSIGAISNHITKIWNSLQPDEDLVKILCFLNNFVIDYAKCLYLPTNPKEWDKRIKASNQSKVPHFFMYAKDKTIQQVAPVSKAVTDRLLDKIQSYKFDFQKKQLGTLDYKMLMHNPDLELDEHAQKLIRHYYKLVSNIGNYNIERSDDDNCYAQALKNFKDELSKFGDEQYITDVLVKQLFDVRKAARKSIFWDCYGHIVYENLQANKAGEKKMCHRCGTRFTPLHRQQCLCSDCAKYTTRIPEAPRTVICFDCGKEFVPSDLTQTRCQVCQWMYDNPVVTGNYTVCKQCGAHFDTPRGRGRRATMCRRCQDLAKKAKYYKYNHGNRHLN